jgi:hypothetical protein
LLKQKTNITGKTSGVNQKKKNQHLLKIAGAHNQGKTEAKSGLFFIKKQRRTKKKMSHTTSVKTQIKDLSLLDAAAKALGLQKVDRTAVNGYLGQKTDAEHVWQVSNSYDLGAIKNANGNYDLVADWWGTDHTVRNLDKKVIQEYSVQIILRRARLLGQPAVREAQSDGSVKVKIRN